MLHFHGKYNDLATQENYVEDTCVIKTSNSSSSFGLHTKLMVEVAQLPSAGVLGMEVPGPGGFLYTTMQSLKLCFIWALTKTLTHLYKKWVLGK
jgi:hypothetical protein